MRTNRSGTSLSQLFEVTPHERMIADCKHHKQISKVATTGIAQLSDVLNTGERVLSAVSYGEFALRHGATDKRTGGLFLNQ